MGSKRKRSVQDAPVAAPAPKKQQKSQGKSTKSKPERTPLDTSPFLNEPRGADLRREVQLYDTLGSEDSDDRLDAANAIILGLLGGEGVEESTLQRHLQRRLFRGLASGRKCSRLGFGVVLTELLRELFGSTDLATTKYTGLTFDKVLGFLIIGTKAEGDLSGQEERDHHLGRVFGLQSFVRAKILFGEKEYWGDILGKLLELAKKKPWTREECGHIIVAALGQMDETQARFTLDQMCESGLAVSPEGVGIWLTARAQFPDLKFPSKPWGISGNPLEHLQTLAKALKESSSEDGGKTQAKQTGAWNPQLHFVWDLVLRHFSEAVKNNKDGVKSEFEHFWKVAVDDNLFSATASRERKFWGFLLYQKLIQDPESYGKLYSSIFSRNLVRCLINHVQQEDRFLNRSANKSLKVLTQIIELKPRLLVEVLPKLIGGHGTYNFDKVTKTKTIEKLLGAVDENNANSVIAILLDPVQKIKEIDEKDVEMRRLMTGDYLLNIIRRVNVTDESLSLSWIKTEALPTLANIAYTQDSNFEPPLSEKTRTIFKNRLMSAFSHLLTDLDAFSYPCDLLQQFSPTAVEMDEGITEAKDGAISTMNKIIKRIKKAGPEDKATLQALSLLYSLVIFQLYNGEPEAVSILDELKLCYDKLIRHKESENSDEASEVLVELLLSFISKPSALLRKVTEHVFGAFMADMTKGGLKLMTDVLESGESLRGQQEMFDQEPEDENIESNEGMDSDVEVVDMDGDEGHLNTHLDESAEESADEDDDDEEAKKLDDALALALSTHRHDPEAEESDSDADMSDSEMMELDSKLVEIFKQRKKVPNKKQEQKDAKETMVNFKARILDLLEIYVKKQSSNPLAFGLLLPLLQLIRTTKTKHLSEKSHNIILAFAKAFKNFKNSTDISDVNVSDQIKLLKSLHLEASKDPAHMFAKASSTASLLVVSSCWRVDKGSVEKIAGVYRDSQVSWVEGEIKMQAAFFVEWVNWCQSHASEGL